jgi:putative colanic acid biosynthesis acetyltransferase WcaF
MPRHAAYDASQHIDADGIADPYMRPAFTRRNLSARLLWNVVHLLFFRSSPRPMFAWRAWLLRLFGASLGANPKIYPGAIIWAPWNLFCGDTVAIANGAEVYNPAPMHFGSHAIVSQGAYLCGATHDYNSAAFTLLAYEMRFGAYSWICARASVAPGVQVGEGAVLGLGAVATHTLEPWTVYAGNPATARKARLHATGTDAMGCDMEDPAP